jgi:hypothetical protein
MFAGCYLMLARCFGLSTAASLWGACAIAFGSYTLSTAHFTGEFVAIMHFPWLLSACFHWLERPTYLRWLAIVAVAALLLLSGHPSFIFATGAGAALIVAAKMMVTRRWRLFLPLAAAPIAAIGVTAVALLPFLHALRTLWTYKSGVVTYQVYSFKQWMERLGWTFFDDPYSLLRADYGTFYSFLGPLIVALACIGGWVAVRERRFVFLFPVLLLTFLFAIPGPWMSGIALLPPIRYGNAGYFFGAFAFTALILASIGVERVSRATRRSTLVSVVLLVALALTLAPRVLRVFHPVRSAEIVLDSPALQFLKREPRPYRVTGMRGQTLLPNAAEWSGIEDLRICSPILHPRYREWFRVADSEGLRDSYASLLTNRRIDSPLMGAFNVRYFVQSRLPSNVASTLESTAGGVAAAESEESGETDRFELPVPINDPLTPLVYQAPSVNIYRNDRNFLPRAYVVTRYTPVPDFQTALAKLRARPAIAIEAPVVESAHPGSVATGVPAPDARATVDYPDDRNVHIAVHTSRASLLVLNDLYADGWSATVDNIATPIVPVNVISRGVFLTAGVHDVRMRFTPPGLKVGVTISCAVALALGIACFVVRRVRVEEERGEV